MYFDPKMEAYTIPCGETWYFLTDEQKHLLKKDISLINHIIYEEYKGERHIPQIIFKDLRFSPHSESVADYTFMKMLPLTKTGKLPKYKFYVKISTEFFDNPMLEVSDMKFRVYNSDKTFGDIYYLQNGEIGKCHIVIWKNGFCDIIDLKSDCKNLVVVKRR